MLKEGQKVTLPKGYPYKPIGHTPTTAKQDLHLVVDHETDYGIDGNFLSGERHVWCYIGESNRYLLVRKSDLVHSKLEKTISKNYKI